MDKTMQRKLVERILAGSRGQQLGLLAQAIHALTIHSRAAYDHRDRVQRMVRVNEALHRLSGHLRDLLDADEPMTSSRAEGVVESLAWLHPTEVAAMMSRAEL